MLNINVILMGSNFVGRKSIMKRFIDEKFSKEFTTQYYVGFLEKKIEILNQKINFNLKTIYERGCRAILTKFVGKNSNVVLLVYDITSKDSFLEIKDYYYEEAKNQSNNEIIFVIVGNKSDLNEKREVEKTEGEEYAKKIGAIFYETSAKTNDNISELFNDLAKIFITRNNFNSKINENINKDEKKISLSLNKFSNENKKKKICK